MARTSEVFPSDGHSRDGSIEVGGYDEREATARLIDIEWVALAGGGEVGGDEVEGGEVEGGEVEGSPFDVAEVSSCEDDDFAEEDDDAVTVEWSPTAEPPGCDPATPDPGTEARTFESIFAQARSTGKRASPEFVYNLYWQSAARLLRTGQSRALSERALVHGRLSPRRIFVGPNGTVDIVWPDWAMHPDEGVYLAPEQMEGGLLDVRSDIFSLALCIAELLSSKPLADPSRTASGHLAEYFRETLRGAPQPVGEIGRILVRSLQRDANQRYETLRLLLADLRSTGQHLGFQTDAGLTARNLLRLFRSEPRSPIPPRRDGSPYRPPPPLPPAPGVEAACTSVGHDESGVPPSVSQVPGAFDAIPGYDWADSRSTLPPPLERSVLPSGPNQSAWQRFRDAWQSGGVKWRSLPLAWKATAAAAGIGMALVSSLVPSRGRLVVAVSDESGQRLDYAATNVDGGMECGGGECRFELSPGLHDVTVRANGYLPQSQLVEVHARDETATNLTLFQASGKLSVSAHPADTRLFVDGSFVGRLPLELNLPAGRHRLRLEAPGYAPQDRIIEVRVAEFRSVSGTVLLPLVRTARFDVRTPGVDLTLVSDAERWEHVDPSSPVRLPSSRKWTLEVRKAGYPILREPLNWGDRSERTFSVMVDGSQETGGPTISSGRARMWHPRPIGREASQRVGTDHEVGSRDESQSLSANLGARTGECRISFNSIPAAHVFLDGTRLGITPLVAPRVHAGTHNVEFAQGREKRTERFACDPGESKVVAVRLFGGGT